MKHHPGAVGEPVSDGRGYSVQRVLADGRLRSLYELFVIAQLLDVISSAAGQMVGLHESNALASAVSRAWGTPGFLASKIPVFVVVLLTLARLPRRTAVVAAVVIVVVSMPVVVWNFYLLFEGTGVTYPEVR